MLLYRCGAEVAALSLQRRLLQPLDYARTTWSGQKRYFQHAPTTRSLAKSYAHVVIPWMIPFVYCSHPRTSATKAKQVMVTAVR